MVFSGFNFAVTEAELREACDSTRFVGHKHP
jgi:hypothetical protein